MNHDIAARLRLLRSSSDAASRVFETILTRSPLSRIDIARITGLSPAAVTKAVSPLVEAGLVDVTRGATGLGSPGRPASPVAIVPDALVFLGIKITVDELIAVATDLTTRVIASARRPLAAHDPGAVTDEIEAAVDTLRTALAERAASIAGIGVAVSGDVDAAVGVVRESAIMGWDAVPLGPVLTRRLGLGVVVENDVRALTIGEHWFGVGLGIDSFAIVTIGRGIGSGLHVNGDVVAGAFGVAGEIGHLPLASRDRICPCGRRGCVEAVAGTAAIEATVSAAHGRPVAIDEVVALARAGDTDAAAAFSEAAEFIGTAIASLVNLAGPELVILGGEGVTNLDLFEQTLRDAFHAHAFGAAAACRILTRPHTFEDWARGAAAATIRELVGRPARSPRETT